jgi:hypothetical protein
MLTLGFFSAGGLHAKAQTLTRTWVSSVTGNDANTCALASPCLTFNGALSKTAPGGEIDVLDPGDYGAVTISKSVTIDGAGTLAGISVSVSGGRGIDINAANSDIVILRNLTLNGTTATFDGIRFRNGNKLVIENVSVFGFGAQGVLVLPMASGAAGNVVISHSLIGKTRGVGAGAAVRTQYGNTVLSNSVVTGNEWGLLAEEGGVIDADSNVLTFNRIAAQSSASSTMPSSVIRLSNNDIYNNTTGFSCGGGVLASAGNNRKGGNTGGFISVCSPNAIITQQ